MGLIANDKGGGDFDPIAQGIHHAVCYSLFDLGTQFSEAFGNWSHKILLCWEFPEERIKIRKEDKDLDLPRATSKEYTLSLGTKANLRKDLETWRGRAFTADELSGFDVKNILGKNCQIQIIHQAKNDKVYANVASITPLMKGISVKTPENPIRYFAFGDGGEIPEGTPEWIIKKIQASKEWKARSVNPGDPGEPPWAGEESPPIDSYDSGNILDEDLPF